MDLGKNIEPYPLSPRELVYAILLNRNFISGRFGTLLAIGSITEPLIFEKHALEYFYELANLGNPIQFSTKKFITSSFALELSRVPTPVSPLVSIITFELSDILEPYAPKPDLRLESIRNLSNAGLNACLFLRPIIVGINYREAYKIMDVAREYGARCVVFGSFRITYRIYKTLKDLGLDMSKVEARANIKLIKKFPKRQYPVSLSRREKDRLIAYARKIGLIPFKSACCANSFNAGVVCPSICFETSFCTNCPNNCRTQTRPSINSLTEALRLLNIHIRLHLHNEKIFIDKKNYLKLVQTLSRRITLPRRP